MAHSHSLPAHDTADKDTSLFTVSNALTGLAIGGAVAGASVILAPYVLPYVGIGDQELAQDMYNIVHGGEPGVAGRVNDALASVPVVGDQLAKGGWFNAATAGTIGVGGLLLGNHMEKKGAGLWGKIVKYAALATSALVALPTVLTALGTGLLYLANAAFKQDSTAYNATYDLVGNYMGNPGEKHNAFLGLSGAAAIAPHFLTCGMPLLPTALSYTLFAKDAHEHMEHTRQNIPLPVVYGAKAQPMPCCGPMASF